MAYAALVQDLLRCDADLFLYAIYGVPRNSDDFHLVRMNLDLPFLRYLVDHGYKILPGTGWKALWDAIFHRHNALLTLLITAGCLGILGVPPPLVLAATHGNAYAVERLLHAGESMHALHKGIAVWAYAMDVSTLRVFMAHGLRENGPCQLCRYREKYSYSAYYELSRVIPFYYACGFDGCNNQRLCPIRTARKTRGVRALQRQCSNVIRQHQICMDVEGFPGALADAVRACAI